MDFDLLPIDEIMEVLEREWEEKLAFRKILDSANEKMSSHIWKVFEEMNISLDILDASLWLQEQLKHYPETKGIYLGLDTLNMDDGKGSNVEIGLSKSCKPNEFSDDWTYDCEDYGSPHLIKGLYEVSATFADEKNWTSDERSFAEYVIFLGYSGVVLREALNKLETKHDFLSIWGFHDGDMFFLMQRVGNSKSVVTGIDL